MRKALLRGLLEWRASTMLWPRLALLLPLSLLASPASAASGSSTMKAAFSVDLPGYLVASALDSSTGHLFVGGSADCHVVESGSVTVGSSMITMLSARTGQILRKTPVDGCPAVLVVAPGVKRLFALDEEQAVNGAGGKASLALLDTTTGRLLRHTTLGIGPLDAAVDDKTARVFIENQGDGTVTTLNAKDGAVLGTISVGRLLLGIPAVVDTRRNRVYLGNGDELDAATGKLLAARFTTSALNPVVAMALDAARGRLFLYGPEAGPFGRSSSAVAAIDVASGRPLFTREPFGPSTCILAVLTFCTYHALAIVPQTGNVLFVTGPDYTGAGGAVLIMLSGTTGAKLADAFVTDQGTPGFLTVDTQRNAAFLVCCGQSAAKGVVVKIGTANGAVLGQTPVAGLPIGMTFDQELGRVFVINQIPSKVQAFDE